MNHTKPFLFFLLSILSILNSNAQLTVKQYEGRLSSEGKADLNITLKLKFDAEKINGTYYYQNNGSNMYLTGNIKGNKIELTESNDKGKETGTFAGTYYTKGDSMVGTWTRKKDKSTMNFKMYKVDWTNYKLIKKSKLGSNFEMEWLEMRENPDTIVQFNFNHLEQNTPRASKAEDVGYSVEEGDTVFYRLTTWTNVSLQTDAFICFGHFDSDYWGGMGAVNNIYYMLYDLRSQKMLKLKDILRTDTASIPILKEWIDKAMQNRDEWTDWKDSYERTVDPEEFYLANDGVYFFFPTGAITNILGFSDVKISYRNFIKILNKTTIVYDWVKRHPSLQN